MPIRTQDSQSIMMPCSLSENESQVFIQSITHELYKGKKIRINFSELTNINSSQVGLIWKMFQICKQAGADLILCKVSKQIMNVFKMLDLDTFLNFEELTFSNDKNQTSRDIKIKKVISIEKSFIPTVEDIDSVKHEIKNLLTETDLNDQFIYELETIFYEVATNIRLHATNLTKENVQFSLLYEKNEITIEFIDYGDKFDPISAKKKYNPNKSISIKQKNGFGINMIDKMTDKMYYKRENNRNILRLTKILRGQNV